MSARRRPVLLAALLAAAVVAPLVARLLPSERDTPFGPPEAGHLLGTDALGRDVLGQLVLHAPATFLVPAIAAVVLAVLGSVTAILIGLAPNRLGRALLRLGDVLVIIPPVVVTLVIVLGFGATPVSVVVAVVLAGLVLFVRVLADATRQVAGSGFVEAAHGFGDSRWRIARRDVLPQLGGIVVAETSLRFLAAVQLVAVLSFLGFAGGLGESWARAVRENVLGFGLNPWATLAPGIALVVTVTVLALIAGPPSAPDRAAGTR